MIEHQNDRDRRQAWRLARALATGNSDAHGPGILRVANAIVDELPPMLTEDLLTYLERPALQRKRLDDRLLVERFSQTTTPDSRTTTVEGETRLRGVEGCSLLADCGAEQHLEACDSPANRRVRS